MGSRAGLLVFDGDCGFCTSSVRFASRWVDRRRRYQVAPWQQLDLDRFGLTEAQCVAAAQFVRPDGSVASGHAAVAEGLKRGALPWRPLGHLLTMPGIGPVAAWAYHWVSEHRYALPGGTPACAATPPTTPADAQ
jgi:predicted DCC family thiol-disulfide oxidoreductase YuxK